MTRRLWTLAHRYLGLSLAAFLSLAAATGAVLAFYPEIDAALNPSWFRSADCRQPLTPGVLVQRVEAQLPTLQVSALRGIGARPPRSVVLTVTPRAAAEDAPDADQVFADPCTGRVLGLRRWGALRFDAAHLMPLVYEFHYTLLVPGNAGITILGIVALLWFVDSVIGVYLTLPRGRPFFRRWRPAWGVQPRRANYDLHRAGGLWFWGVLLVMAMSAVALNLNREVFRPVVGLFGEITPYPTEQLPRVMAPKLPPRLDFDAALRAAAAHLPAPAAHYRPQRLSYLESHRLYRVDFFAPGHGERALHFGLHQVFVDADTGAPRAVHGTVTGTAADVFLALQYPMHSGQILGLPGRILVCLTGLATLLLAITGVRIWLRKRHASTVRAQRRRANEVVLPERSAFADGE